MLPIATLLDALKPIATLATLALTRIDPGAITTRGLMVENPVTHQSAMGELAQDELLIQSTQGSNPGPMARVPQFLFTCAPSFLLQKGLPKNVRGVIGLGHAPISVPTQLDTHFGFQTKFALCLTSSTRSNGVIFFGDGPYYICIQVLIFHVH